MMHRARRTLRTFAAVGMVVALSGCTKSASNPLFGEPTAAPSVASEAGALPLLGTVDLQGTALGMAQGAPGEVWFAAHDGTKLVAHRINTRTGTAGTPIVIDAKAAREPVTAMLVAQRAKRLYVQVGNRVTVVDTAADRVLGTATLPKGAKPILLDGDTVYRAAANSGGALILKLDPVTLKEQQRLQIKGSGDLVDWDVTGGAGAVVFGTSAGAITVAGFDAETFTPTTITLPWNSCDQRLRNAQAVSGLIVTTCGGRIAVTDVAKGSGVTRDLSGSQQRLIITADPVADAAEGRVWALVGTSRRLSEVVGLDAATLRTVTEMQIDQAAKDSATVAVRGGTGTLAIDDMWWTFDTTEAALRREGRPAALVTVATSGPERAIAVEDGTTDRVSVYGK